MLTEKEKNNFKEAISDTERTLKLNKKELKKAEECLDSIKFNYFEERIEKNTAGILKFYINDLKIQIKQDESLKKAYQNHLQER